MDSNSNHKAIVLYVDDVQANLMLFQASFGSFYEVLLADSGKSALAMLKEKEVHVLVSDQNMPGMTGNELLSIVANEYPDIMRFMITAYTDYDVVVDAINKGDPYGFFNKPYNRDDVRNAINRSLEVRGLRIKNREMIKKLEKANEIMVGADRSKTNFLASVTDEIRTPINKIMTVVHMIKDKTNSGELAELLNLLDGSVRKLEKFSESTKHLERLYDPELRLDKKPISLNEIVEVGIIENGNLLSSENIEVKFEEGAENAEIEGEYDLIQSAFYTLLGFIIEYTDSGTEIILGIQKGADNVSLSIRSDSSRYSEQQKKEFSSLSDDNVSLTEKDFSLELFLASEVMKVHEGRLTFNDQGATSQFIFEFPV